MQTSRQLIAGCLWAVVLIVMEKAAAGGTLVCSHVDFLAVLWIRLSFSYFWFFCLEISSSIFFMAAASYPLFLSSMSVLAPFSSTLSKIDPLSYSTFQCPACFFHCTINTLNILFTYFLIRLFIYLIFPTWPLISSRSLETLLILFTFVPSVVFCTENVIN